MKTISTIGRNGPLVMKSSSSSKRHMVWLFARHWAALASVGLFAYVVVGSIVFPQWWCVFLWRGGYRHLPFTTEALWDLLDNHFPLFMLVIFSLILLMTAGALLRLRLPWIAEYAGWIAFGVLVTLIVDALIVYHIQINHVAWFGTTAKFQESIEKLRTSLQPPKIVPPIYFHYLDPLRVEGLYNQIQPELEERERTELHSNGLKGNAEADLGGSKVGVEGEKSSELKSTYGRSEFSVDRKCMEVMKYAIETWPASYYTTAENWYANQGLLEAERRLLPARPIGGFKTDEELRAEWLIDLETQLKSVHGLIFVDGTFHVSTGGQGTVLVEQYAERPFKASFRALIPGTGGHDLSPAHPLHITVFGDVTRPFGEDAVIDISPVAVY